MPIFLILALLIAVVAAMFALQNVAAVTITFFIWHIQTSLAVAMLVALAAGIVITLFVSIPGRYRTSRNTSAQKKRVAALEAERDEVKRKIDAVTAERDTHQKNWQESQKEVANLEEQLASISAALEAKQSSTPADTQPIPPQESPTPPQTPA